MQTYLDALTGSVTGLVDNVYLVGGAAVAILVAFMTIRFGVKAIRSVK